MKHQSDLWFLYDFNYQQLKIKDKNDFYMFNTAKFNCSPKKAIEIVDTYLDLNNDKNKEYKEVKEKEELENKIKDIKQEEIVIINSENFKKYIKKDKDVQIGEYIVITK